jgi:asparagine synthase (glutamine-hydrolysing)
MQHEAYYAEGEYINSELGLYLGWQAHFGSLAQNIPFVSRDKRLLLFIVGEHFSHTPLGSSVHSAHDLGEALTGILELSDVKFLQSLNGWFSGILIDLHLRQITLFNDRFGMGRVYVHEGTDEFVFATEAKALLRVRPGLRRLSSESLAQYLRSNCVMGNKTLFEGISLLPSGSAWTFKSSPEPRKSLYFDFAQWEQQPVTTPEIFNQKFYAVVSELLPAYLDGAVGLSLTAGLDTRVLLSGLDQQQDYPCYTFGGMWGETFDIRIARKLSALCHQSHEVIGIDRAFLSEFPRYAQKSVYISDGTHDVLGAHDVYFNEVARKIAPIRLTGKFGSEVVRTRRLIPWSDFPRHLLHPELSLLLDRAPNLDEVSQKRHPLTRVVAEEIAWYEFGRVSVEQSQITLRTPYMDNSLVKLMYEAPFAVRASRVPQAKYVRAKCPEIADVPTNMGKVREDGELMGKLAYGLYWALFKTEFLYLYATPHWLTRVDRALGALRPERLIAGRQKFEGYRIWFKTHLAEFVRETLLRPQAYCVDFFNKKWVETIVMRHTSGTHNYLNELNKMLTIELICSSLLRPPNQTNSEVQQLLRERDCATGHVPLGPNAPAIP